MMYSRQFSCADFKFSICFSAWLSIFCLHELKMLQILAECLNGKGFHNVTSEALYKNFNFVYTVTYFLL